ncbi:hypothetical protein [Streptomyces sp. MMBL 11-1]|uniref:hypothetical protein n=1 Tax=Streptomyces sp. MMBL 11-1 TaxID=3026420 RepID=UPI00236172B3|nr:hypothetical protein [Streptomyces sp. MMBL 11-1]
MPDIELEEAPALFRGMLRDIVACSDYQEVCRKLGLVPASPDVDRIEHLLSHTRIEEFNRLATDAFRHADVAALVLYRLSRIHDEDDADSEVERQMFQAISRTAVATVVAHLLEKGRLGVCDV